MIKKLRKNQNNIFKFGVMFGISLLVILGTFFFQDKLAQFRALGLLGIFILNFFSSVTVFLPAPGIATVLAGGAVYNPILVGLLAGIGAALGDMVGFFLGESGNEVFLRRKEGNKYELVKTLFQKYGPAIIFIFAFVPNPLFDAIGLIAGAFAYSPKKFFLIMLSARICRNLILAFIGAKVI